MATQRLDAYCRNIDNFSVHKKKTKPKKLLNNFEVAGLIIVMFTIFIIISVLSLETRTKAIICQDSTYFRVKAENFAHKKGIIVSQIYYYSDEIEARQKAKELKDQAMVTFAFASEFNVSDLVEQQYYK